MSDERSWIERCQKGDRIAFEPLVKSYQRRAYLAALAMTGNRDDAMDLSQEAFIRAFVKIAQFDLERSFYPWYHQILKNCWRNWLAKKAGKNEVPLNIDRGDIHLDPSHLVEEDERQKQLLEAIQSLPHQYREILHLKYFLGLKYKEIGEVLSIPQGTVMFRLYEARSRLKKKYTLPIQGEKL